MRYQVILFDVDDTLLDFKTTEENALQKTFSQFGFATGSSDYRATYKEISKGLWEDLEKGRITLAELGVERFRRLFKAVQLDIDAEVFGSAYLESLGKEVHLVPGAVELCNSLKDCRLVIITNGFASVQTTRIAASPLCNAFEHLIISEEVGYKKPDREIFEYAFSKLQWTEKASVLMVGDSLTSDIQGGAHSGIDTCWFNPLGKENQTSIQPTYEIRELSELQEIVRKGNVNL
ncbi:MULTISPECIES: YjjG family noncanonical pyrimidine nucleotidase [Brevibacillus]|uniref:YjjG family noncanonical pyrimidine nucleotidase n=1 Tax=Brevibacillus TaxID=55080 RepID=UPI000D1036FE|nr:MULTISPECIES: YjjG family noncanonical pyrimidine nucleotidase [Brevibacillus]MED1943759.1 YjjG family noncanonical pyrimidine nucleotidase [Brevibacillus formosus]MED1999869.1 YjjG family noncanonical pyrimidine nucleotidase [Brevibacillus formosus]MED2081994.1 YjjG family noncanonical pyrimidine nucleotidase [Brevibacillus formosus]PSK19067.1 noncanonical pyrimidine nucleotidase, YjjG family [Brevibacillus sp. NRRL NRS-603]